MSVTQPKIIDASGISKEDGRVILNIMDPLPFDGPERLYILQAKINDYLDFVDSGQVAEIYPTSISDVIEIHVWFRFDPDPEALAFLRAVKVTLADAGLLFAYTHQPQSDPTSDNAEQVVPSDGHKPSKFASPSDSSAPADAH